MVTVVSTVYNVNVGAGVLVSAVLTALDIKVLCTITPDIDVPTKLPDMSTAYPEYDIKLHFTPSCKLYWVPYPKNVFPIEVTVAFNDVPFTRTLASSADLSHNYASDILTLIDDGTITSGPLKVEVTYPRYIRYYLLTGRKTIDWVTKTVTVATGLEPPGPGCVDTTFTCADKSVITTGRCDAKGNLIPTGEKCPGEPEPECTVDTTKFCDDGSEITTHRCVLGNLVPTGILCPGEPEPPEPAGTIVCNTSLIRPSTPANIPFKRLDPTDPTSLLTLDLSKFDVTTAISVSCQKSSSSTLAPAGLFPMGMNLIIDDGKSDYIQSVEAAAKGIFTVPIINTIIGWMATKTQAELLKLSGITLILSYYGTVTFADATKTGIGTERKRVEKWIPFKKPDIDVDDICTTIGEATSLTYPAKLSFDMSSGTPKLTDAAWVKLAMTAVCGGATPADIFSKATAVITLGNTVLSSDVKLPGGKLDYNLASDSSWLQEIKDDMASIALEISVPRKIDGKTGQVTDRATVTRSVRVDIPTPTPKPEPEPEPDPDLKCTVNTVETCDDGSEVTTHLCIGGRLYPTWNVCPTPSEGCKDGWVRDPHICDDGSRIYLEKCVSGVWVDSGQKCPDTRPAARKSVYTTTPLLARVGKRIQIVGLVYCGTEKVGGEKARISINGELLTTANTRNGVVVAEWTPVVAGLYTICVTVPASSACNAYASGCTMMQVVDELSKEEIEAAEEEFKNAKDRIGELMERI